MGAAFEIAVVTVSIHTPVRGRPLGAVCPGLLPASFNPHPREGATGDDLGDVHLLKVSIHTPVRGRRMKLPDPINTITFQSTPP